MKERKKELRRWIASEKKKYSDSTLKELSGGILSRLEAQPAFKEAHIALLYHSMKDEVQTHSFIEKWSKQKKIILPVVVGDILELRLYSGVADFKIGLYGIAEPTGELFTDYETIDIAVIPGVAFDLSGHRLGHGKGYYDKLLPKLTTAVKAGLCFPFQMIEKVPTEPFDIPMDIIIA